MKVAMKYAVLRFMPYPETGEFANVGILCASSKLNKIEYRLAVKPPKRIGQFFNHLDKSVYKTALSALDNELALIKANVERGLVSSADAFALLTKPKATILGFDTPRTCLADGLLSLVETAYDDLVEHEFARNDSYEVILNRRVKQFIGSLELATPFVRKTLKKGDWGVQFDLVQHSSETDVNKIIKPLFFDFSDEKKCIDHIDAWNSKFRRLDRYKLLPKDRLIPIELNDQSEESFDEVFTEFKEFGDVILANQENSIREFAIK